MSWGDVWVSSAKVRPEIDEDVPPSPWVLAGVVTTEERAIIEAVQRLNGTRSGHARTVDFYLHATTPSVTLSRAGARSGTLSFEPDGLWVALDLTAAGSGASPRFAAFKQRVRTATLGRRAPDPQLGSDQRALAVLPLRAHAPSRSSALEWVYRGSAG